MNVISAAIMLLALAGSQATTNPQHYDSWQAFQNMHPDTQCPGFFAPSFEGDLNKDGVADKVVLINPDKHHSQLFILLGEERGGYQISGQSNVFEWGCDLAPTVIAQDGRNSFHLQLDAGGYKTGDVTLRFRFTLRDRVWRWTGEDVVNCSAMGTAKEKLTRREVLSVDFLSGRYVDVFQYAGRTVKTERGRRHFPAPPLRDFYYYKNPALDSIPSDDWFWDGWAGSYCNP